MPRALGTLTLGIYKYKNVVISCQLKVFTIKEYENARNSLHVGLHAELSPMQCSNIFDIAPPSQYNPNQILITSEWFGFTFNINNK